MAWPTDFDTLATNKTDQTPQASDHPSVHNAIARMIMAIQQELGTNPSGSDFSNVAARLDDLQAAVEAFGGPGSGAILESIAAARGDILVGLGDDSVGRHAPGTFGQFLMCAPLTTTGMLWYTPSFGYQVYDVVLDGGADNTGATDATGAITAALAVAAGNKRVRFPAGTYLINSAIQIPSNSYLFGDIQGRSVLKASNGHDDSWISRNVDIVNGNSNITLENMTFDGNKANRADSGASVCGFRGSYDHSSPCRNIKVLDCWLHDSPGLGFAFQGVYETLVRGCTVKNNTRDGISFGRGCRWNRIQGNHVIGAGDDHIAYASGAATSEYSSDCAIVGNVIGDANPTGSPPPPYAAGGITLSGVQNVTVNGNTIRGGDGWGIKLWNNNLNAINGVSITGNTLNASGSGTSPSGNGVGIWMEVSNSGGYGGSGSAAIKNVTITGNVIQNPRYSGIQIRGLNGFEVQQVTISDNVLVGGGSGSPVNNAHGIFIDQYFRNVRMDGNTITDFAANGVHIGGLGGWVDIENNTIANNNRKTAGAGINLGGVAFFTVVNNRVTDQQTSKTQVYGIEYSGATQGLVANNDFRGNLTKSRSTTAKDATVLERMNFDQTGVGTTVLRIGDAGTAGTLA